MKGLGCDIIEVSRIKEVLEKHGQHFKDRTFTKSEQAYCDSKREPERHYAVRFAAKEAVAKALGCGFGKELSFLDIEISRTETGKPLAALTESAKSHHNDPDILISLSHCKEYAQAVAFIS